MHEEARKSGLGLEKEKLERELREREEEVQAHAAEKQNLQKLIEELEHKVVFGGHALEEKEREEAKKERELKLRLKRQKKKEKALINEKLRKEEEILMVSKNYQSLQEEVDDMREVMTKLRERYRASLNEIRDLQEEHERGREDLLETIREQEREAMLQAEILAKVFYPEELLKLRDKAKWNTNKGRWKVPEFFLKEKQVSLPTLSNARGINEAEKEGRDIVYASKESPGNSRKMPRGSSREHGKRNALAANSVQVLHSFS